MSSSPPSTKLASVGEMTTLQPQRPAMNLQPFLEGSLLRLRPLREDDFAELYKVAADPLIWDQHPAHDRHIEAVFQKTLFEPVLISGGALVALDAKDDRIVGSSTFENLDDAESEVEIGWTFLARRCWGGAFNGEMKRLMLEHAFQFVEKVVFRVATENFRSQGAVQKIGGRLIGSRPGRAGTPSLLFRITKAEWLAHRGEKGGNQSFRKPHARSASDD